MDSGLCDLIAAHVWSSVIDAALTALLLYPIYKFLWSGWQRRRDEIIGSLNAQAKRSYLAIFRKHDPTNNVDMSPESAEEKFDDMYRSEYGPHNLIVPVGLLVLVVVVENFFLAKTLQAVIADPGKPDPFTTAAAAIAGAYTFVCWDLFARMQQRTMSQAGILRSTLRLAVAVPIGFAFASIATKASMFIAFGIGAFPLQAISVLLQRQVKKYLSLESATTTTAKPDTASNGITTTTLTASRDQVFALNGIDTAIAERIEDADITTITQLAWADPVQLTMRTNLQFAFVLDIISQALAWVYLEDKLKKLGVVGLRGAVEIRSALDDIQVQKAFATTKPGDKAADPRNNATKSPAPSAEDVEKAAKAEEEKVLAEWTSTAAYEAIKQAAKLAEVSEGALLYGLMQIGNDPTTDFLSLSWASLTEAQVGSTPKQA